MLNPVASTVLVASYVLFGVILCGLLGGLCFALFKLNARLDQITQRLDPLLDKADGVLTQAAQTIEAVGGRTEAVLSYGEDTVETIHEKIEQTAQTVQTAVNAPIIKANSLLAGVTQGFLTFTHLQKRGRKLETKHKNDREH